MENDKRNGQGACKYSNGDSYKGQWKDDDRDGQGICKYFNGDRYEGQFKNGEKSPISEKLKTHFSPQMMMSEKGSE